ncbi:hypothetical protein [Segetibacter koreensis]|uniref:hypothetical protein n=1 Tax=Segetibacter koreensis TaxID=398037 RepID=UPI00039984AF|nr:hypothetical protein [Segetibacter koreensis]
MESMSSYCQYSVLFYTMKVYLLFVSTESLLKTLPGLSMDTTAIHGMDLTDGIGQLTMYYGNIAKKSY